MEKRWLLASSSGDGVNGKEEEEETLSLVNLPQVQHSKTEETEQKESNSHEDFNFCRSFSSKSEMCTADEVFFKGQIMPLRNSVSSEKGSTITPSISRTESMDRYYSGGLFSSRSSSLSSSSSSAATLRNKRQLKPPRNQFHSHPSPSPRLQKQETFNSSYLKCNKKSSMSSVFRLGLVTPPPEIAFQDFKTRFHSHRSNSNKSTNSNNIGGNVKNSEKKHALFGAGCKCSVDTVDTVSSNVMLVKERQLQTVQLDEENVNRRTKLTKKQISHHRTFEWLRQLSIEGDREEA